MAGKMTEKRATFLVPLKSPALLLAVALIALFTLILGRQRTKRPGRCI